MWLRGSRRHWLLRGTFFSNLFVEGMLRPAGPPLWFEDDVFNSSRPQHGERAFALSGAACDPHISQGLRRRPRSFSPGSCFYGHFSSAGLGLSAPPPPCASPAPAAGGKRGPQDEAGNGALRQHPRSATNRRERREAGRGGPAPPFPLLSGGGGPAYPPRAPPRRHPAGADPAGRAHVTHIHTPRHNNPSLRAHPPRPGGRLPAPAGLRALIGRRLPASFSPSENPPF